MSNFLNLATRIAFYILQIVVVFYLSFPTFTNNSKSSSCALTQV